VSGVRTPPVFLVCSFFCVTPMEGLALFAHDECEVRAPRSEDGDGGGGGDDTAWVGGLLSAWDSGRKRARRRQKRVTQLYRPVVERVSRGGPPGAARAHDDGRQLSVERAELRDVDSFTAEEFARTPVPALDAVLRLRYLARAVELLEAREPAETAALRAWLARLDHYVREHRTLAAEDVAHMEPAVRAAFWVVRAHLLVRLHGGGGERDALRASRWVAQLRRLLDVERHVHFSDALVAHVDALELQAARLLVCAPPEAYDHPAYLDGGDEHCGFHLLVRDAEMLLGAARDEFDERLRLQRGGRVRAWPAALLPPGDVRAHTRRVWQWAAAFARQQSVADDVNERFRRRMHACALRPGDRERYLERRRQTASQDDATAVMITQEFRQMVTENLNAWRRDERVQHEPVAGVLDACADGRWHTALLACSPRAAALARDELGGGIDLFEQLALDLVLRFYFTARAQQGALDPYLVPPARLHVTGVLDEPSPVPRLVCVFNVYELVHEGALCETPALPGDAPQECRSLARAFLCWLTYMCRHHPDDGAAAERLGLFDVYDAVVQHDE